MLLPGGPDVMTRFAPLGVITIAGLSTSFARGSSPDYS
jgi:hypothetical protein